MHFTIKELNRNYIQMIGKILHAGVEVDTRNSITKRIPAMSAEFNRTPLITVRRTAWKNALREFEWFMSGSNDINQLHPKVHHWWAPWANDEGFIKRNYGEQFRNFYGRPKSHTEPRPPIIDQIEYLMEGIKNHPFSRRNVITTWNTRDMAYLDTPITNCHGTVIQAFVNPKNNELSISMYQRSSDMILGVPHNWIQYWAFLLYLAHHCNRKVGKLHWIGGDCHVYKDHYKVAEELRVTAKDVSLLNTGDLPELVYNASGDDFKADDFEIINNQEPLVKTKVRMVV